MGKLVRKGVFETNSSSSHSIALATEDKQFVLDTIYPNQHGEIHLTGGEFGWDWFKHNDAETKANYAAVDFDNDEQLTEMLHEVIKEQTGATSVINDFTSEYSGGNYSYIDHDSHGIVPRHREGLKNFIFNKNSWLFGGNDNSTPDPTFYHVSEIRDGKMIVPEYKYELSVEGLEKTTKYLTKPTDEELSDGLDALLSHRLMNKDGHFIDPETCSSIHFQITRKNDLFEYSSWRFNQDFSDGYVVMTKENSIYGLESKLEESGKFKGLNWEEKSKVLREEVLKDTNISKKLKFTLKEI